MTDQLPPELFAERPIRSDFARGGPSYAVRRIITVCVVLIILGSGGYWAYMRSPAATPGVLPTIATEGPYKQKPQTPGGIDIPHQDVEVYQQLDNNNGGTKPQVEHLLPPPETPQAPPVLAQPASAPVTSGPPTALAPPVETLSSSEAPASPQTAIVPAPSIGSTVIIKASSPPSVPPSVAPLETPPPVKTENNSSPVLANASASSSPPSLPASKANEQPATAPANSHGKNASVIQLASMPDKSAAALAMGKLETKYASLLGPLKLRLIAADLGDRGIYYRIQSTPISKDQANSLCKAFAQQNAGCIIVRE